MPSSCPKLILEGTRLTHKSDLALALDEHPRIVGPRRYRHHAPLISAERCAFTNLPWARLFEPRPYHSWTVDRFHVSAPWGVEAG